MLIIETKNYKEMSKRGCQIIIDEILEKPDLVMGFVTGNTVIGLYGGLVSFYKKGEISFSKITSFNLDEYYPIDKKDKKSFYYYMFNNLFDKINIKKLNINLLDGETKDVIKECSKYEEKIREKKIDLQILGVGVNGHIGFNEPGSKLNSKTRLVNLKEQTIKINSKNGKIPEKAMTMGIDSIMSAKKIILFASGKEKAKAIKRLIKGPVGDDCPVSFLKQHDNLIVVIDKDAGRLIR